MNVATVAKAAETNAAFKERLEDDPVTTLETLAALPLQSDVWIYRVIVVSLGSVVILALLGGLTLAFYDKPTPEGVIALGSGALGAIAGLLVMPAVKGR